MDHARALIVEQIPHLRRYARALLRDPVDADDLVQDCLTRAIDRLHLWAPGSNMRAWLFAILRNQYVNQSRRRAARPDRVSLTPAHDPDNGRPAAQEAALAVQDVASALEQLPEEQREAVLLIGLEGLAYKEAAEVLDVPVGTVMSRLSRGRRKLRELIDQREGPTLRRVK